MTNHFAAFSFVDRITAFEPGVRARGTFVVPAAIAAFPGSLVAEATGQLAAWAAMAAVGFRTRPVAALAGDTRFLGSVAPGATLALAVELESCDGEAVAYSGWAEVDGVRVLELYDCFGAMLPVADFDDPEALRARCAMLCGAGAPPNRFQGVAAHELVALGGEPGRTATAKLRVPAAAPFFDDHFPRRPVYPATLLLDAQMRLALDLVARAAPDRRYTPTRMTRVKVRAFTPPGSVLELGAQIEPVLGDHGTVALSARADGKSIATSKLEVSAEAA